MCDPFLNAGEFLARTEQSQAIIFVAFASGALPDRLVPAMQQRMNEGIPIFVLSNNPGDKHGILAIHYDAGSRAYKSGAVALQKINVNHHEELKRVIADCLAEGLSGPALTKEIEQRYAFKEGEPLPLAQWDDPNYVAPPRKEIRQILLDSGFMDTDGNYIPDTNK